MEGEDSWSSEGTTGSQSTLAILDGLRSGVLVLSVRGIVESADLASARTLEVERDSPVGQSLDQVLHGRRVPWAVAETARGRSVRI
jgi:hypothetical protein